jgi:hypothetical protein
MMYKSRGGTSYETVKGARTMKTLIVKIGKNTFFAKQWAGRPGDTGPLNICEIGVPPIKLRGEFRWVPLSTPDRVLLTELANKKGAKVTIVQPKFYFEKHLRL